MAIKGLYILLLSIVSYSYSYSQRNIPTEKINYFKNIANNKNDTTYIVNFWATWCVPCVAELPYFDSITIAYKNQKVKVILISLDAKKRKEEILVPFIAKRKIQSEIVLLDEPNYNSWINIVNKKWEGNLPATFIINAKNKYKKFIANEIDFEILNKMVAQSLKKN